METKTIIIGDTEVEVVPAEGTLIDGVLDVSSVDVNIKGETYMSLSESVNWEDSEAITSEIRAAWMENGEWPDTSNPNWDAPRNITPNTDKWETLLAVVEEYPITNKELDELVEYEYSASSHTADLKDDNMIAVVDNGTGPQILVPTHIGLKNVYEHNGLDGESGLANLFDSVKNDEFLETETQEESET